MSEPVASTAAQGAGARTPSLSEQPQTPTPSRTAASPSISGPSFLGLNDSPPAGRRAGLSIDPHASSGSNLDYLLEDQEPHKGWGAGKFVLILLVLMFAAGLGYFRWKHGLPPWSIPPDKKFPAAQSTDTADTNSATPAGNSAGTAASPSAAQPAANPDANSAAAANSAATSPATTSPATNPAASNQSPANPTAAANSPVQTGPVHSSQSQNGPAPLTPDAPAEGDAATPSDSTSSPATPATRTPVTAAAEAPRAAPHPKPAAALPKPPAEARPVSDSVAEAQKYLYGRGVPQDCERGMHLLKPAAAQSNPKAMIEMGALYSAGLCTPHDLPTAYRWFALALRKDPDNQSVQADLQKLWGEMTQPERQLAIKLSQ
ncbi:MAG TPA: hypothetical protein VGM18_19685 [Candidatus Sulfotelmatobacter sp.]